MDHLTLNRPRQPRVFNKLSRRRFAQDRTEALIAHLGRQPSYPEMLLIQRVISVEWELRRMDAKLDAGEELSGHAIRGRLAAETRLRLDLQALGLQPQTLAAKPTPTLAGYLGRKA